MIIFYILRDVELFDIIIYFDEEMLIVLIIMVLVVVYGLVYVKVEKVFVKGVVDFGMIYIVSFYVFCILEEIREVGGEKVL